MYENWAITLLLICIIPLAILIISAIVIRVINARKKNNQREENIESLEVDTNQRTMFFEAYGGESNINSINGERNKISVIVKDIELVDGSKLQDLGASGVLLIGSEVRASYGERAPYVLKMLQSNIDNVNKESVEI